MELDSEFSLLHLFEVKDADQEQYVMKETEECSTEQPEAALDPQPDEIAETSATQHCEDTSNSDGPESSDGILSDPAVLDAQVKITNPGSYREFSPNGFKGNYSAQDNSGMLSSEHSRALLMLSSQQLELLLQFVSTLREQRNACRAQLACRFCKKNGEAEAWYSCHSLKDNLGRVECPVLRMLQCPRCGATGDDAHTIKYCPEGDLGIFY